MRKLMIGLASVLAGAGQSAAAPPDRACVMTAQEQAWVDRALAASDYIMDQRLHLPRVPHPTIILFNEYCRFESSGSGKPGWVGEAHSGKIRLLKNSIPAGIVAMEDSDQETGQEFFVMSLPSIWEAAGAMKPGDDGLTAVFLHEFSHSRQGPALKPVIDAATAKYRVPDYFNDDSLQKRFENDPAYVAVYEKEAGLLYRAAAEPDDAKARELAKQALDLMEARQKRWFTGEDAMWKPWDDIYLTMEGFGQWNAYAWLSDPKGGGMSRDAARDKMRGKRRWWSQEEGLGLFLVIDRFVPDWPIQAFAARPKLGIDLLREAVAKPAAQPVT